MGRRKTPCLYLEFQEGIVSKQPLPGTVVIKSTSFWEVCFRHTLAKEPRGFFYISLTRAVTFPLLYRGKDRYTVSDRGFHYCAALTIYHAPFRWFNHIFCSTDTFYVLGWCKSWKEKNIRRTGSTCPRIWNVNFMDLWCVLLTEPLW